MNDGIFETNSGQKKAIGREDGSEGIYDSNSGARKATGGALAKVDNGKGSALAAFVKEGANKMARIVAEGKDGQMDAQRVMYFLASYGDGDKLGKYVFTSMELVGRGEFMRDVREMEWTKDPSNPIGSGVQTQVTRQVPVAAVPASDDGKKLDMSGIRLRDAVHLLRNRGWVETDTDGECGQDCDFATVKLTAQGRDVALTAVKAKLAKGGVEFNEGFGGMPDLFDPSFGGAPKLTDLEQQTAMLTKAKVAFSIEHDEHADNGPGKEQGRATIVINDKPAFTFDAEGSLLNTSKTASARDVSTVDAKVDAKVDATDEGDAVDASAETK